MATSTMLPRCPNSYRLERSMRQNTKLPLGSLSITKAPWSTLQNLLRNISTAMYAVVLLSV